LIKVVVIGAGGRMGKTIVTCVEDTQGVVSQVEPNMLGTPPSEVI